jgi:hypothetical protein
MLEIIRAMRHPEFVSGSLLSFLIERDAETSSA